MGSGKGMSEYERQKRAYQREQRRTSFWRFVKVALVLVSLVGLGYFAFAVYFSDIESKLRAARPKLEVLQADRVALKERLKVLGYGKGQGLAQLKTLRTLLKDEGFKRLQERYLGAVASSRNMTVLAGLDKHIALIEQLEREQAHLSRLEKGRVAGREAASTVAARNAKRDEVDRLAAKVNEQELARADVTSKAVTLVVGVVDTISARIDAVGELEQKLEQAKELKESLSAWLKPEEQESK